MSLDKTVPGLSVLFMVITLVISLGVPIALAIWSKVHYKKAFSFVPLALGAAAFLVFQGLIRIPILQVLSLQQWFKDFVQNDFWTYSLLLAFTAGLFEEPARFLVFSILKKRHSFVDGLSYGIGHGGIESIFIVGLAFINNIVLSIMVNTGTIQRVIAAAPESTRANLSAGVTELITTSSTMFLMAGAERLFTVFIQIALSLLVLRGFQTGRRWLWLGVAILAHTVVDFSAVAMQKIGLTGWTLEGVVALFAVLGLWYIVTEARRYRRELPKTEEDFYGHQG